MEVHNTYDFTSREKESNDEKVGFYICSRKTDWTVECIIMSKPVLHARTLTELNVSLTILFRETKDDSLIPVREKTRRGLKKAQSLKTGSARKSTCGNPMGFVRSYTYRSSSRVGNSHSLFRKGAKNYFCEFKHIKSDTYSFSELILSLFLFSRKVLIISY